MYCQHCGEKMNDNQAICIKCGVLVGKGNAYCANCGKELTENAAICTSCGYSTNSVNNVPNNAKRQVYSGNKYFPIGLAVISVLAIISLSIPHYFIYSGRLGTHYYSFFEWADVLALLALFPLFSTPIVSFVGLKQKRNYSLVTSILSVITFIATLCISIEESTSEFGAMFPITILLLIANMIFAISEAILPSLLTKTTNTPINQNVASPVIENKTATQKRIYCKNCGTELNQNQAICIKCGISVGNGNSYCANCGNVISENADFCMNCGVAIKATKYSNPNASTEYPGGQDKTTLALICFFLGSIGIHNFIMGEQKKGIMKVCLFLLFGVSSIFALIDFVKILTDKYEVNFERYF